MIRNPSNKMKLKKHNGTGLTQSVSPVENMIRIATRKSPLALAQTELVQNALLALYPDLNVEIVPLTTKGDEILDKTLNKIGGKGLFIKELEKALMDKTADIAVHSMKDVPVQLEDEIYEHLEITCIMEREDPSDVFVSTKYAHYADLPEKAIVGTSSLRRQAQILALRSDITVQSLRGNVNTRLKKLHNGEFDAIILAAAGLIRLNMVDRIAHCFSEDEILPGVGQGAIGIECRKDDIKIKELLAPLNHDETALCLVAERAVNQQLNGDCHTPIAAFARLQENSNENTTSMMYLEALVASPDGNLVLRTKQKGDSAEAAELGRKAAEDLLSQGAEAILRACQIEG